jgi:hypothetical protein
MKSSLKKIRDFALHRSDQNKDAKRRDGPHQPVSPHEELLQAAKVSFLLEDLSVF